MDPGRLFPKHDNAVREWLAAHGWPVTDTFGLPYARLYGWRHEGPDGRFTLYVPEGVLSAHEPLVFCALLETLDAKQKLREAQNVGGALLVDEAGLVRLRNFFRFEP